MRKSAIVAICVSLLSAAFSFSPAGQWVERALFLELSFKARGSRPAPEGVVVVSMDERGADVTTSTRGSRLWSRRLYAALTDRLNAAEAAVVVLDVTFEGASDESADIAFESTLSRSSNVVLFNRLRRIDEGDVVVKPLSRFSSVAPVQAVFALPKHSRVDSYWPFYPVLNTDSGDDGYTELPSLPIAAFQLKLLELYGTDPFEQVLANKKSIIGANSGWHEQSDIGAVPLMASLREAMLASKVFGSNVDQLFTGVLESDPAGLSMLRSLVSAHSKRGMQALNFYGPSRTVRTIDHMSVLAEGETNLSNLRDVVSGKVVFIGHSSAHAVDQRDGFHTVFTQNGLDLSGVEIAATAYGNLLDRSTLQRASLFENIILHLLLGLVFAMLVRRKSLLQSILIATLLATAYFAFSLWVFANAYIILPVGIPLLVLLPVTLFSLMFVRQSGIDAIFGIYRERFRQLNPAIVWDDMRAGAPDMISPKPMQGACMITDVEDFTYYSELLGYDAITKISQEYFSLITAHVTETGGELFEVDGDSITAFWDSANTIAGSGHLAVSAAISMRNDINLFNQRYAATPFKTRMGLNYGPVEASYIGGGGKYRYCLVGDVANTSSRLESLNKRLGTTLLASSAVVSDVEKILVRPVGTFMLKGKRETMKVVEIIDHQTVAFDSDRIFTYEFCKALKQLSDNQLEAAEQNFVNILLKYGTDGPARFYLELLTGHAPADERLGEAGIVYLDGK